MWHTANITECMTRQGGTSLHVQLHKYGSYEDISGYTKRKT